MLTCSLSEGFGQLESLQELNMAGCNSLLSLPDGFCDLTNLTKLTFGAPGSAVSKLESLPERFGDLTSLEDLDMTACTSVVSLPESFCRLSNLKKLNLSAGSGYSMKLESLPERFGELPSLEDLKMNSCHALAKNEETYAILSKISTLTKLSLAFCNMESLPEGSP